MSTLSSLKHALAVVLCLAAVAAPLLACPSSDDEDAPPKVSILTIASKSPAHR